MFVHSCTSQMSCSCQRFGVSKTTNLQSSNDPTDREFENKQQICSSENSTNATSITRVIRNGTVKSFTYGNGSSKSNPNTPERLNMQKFSKSSLHLPSLAATHATSTQPNPSEVFPNGSTANDCSHRGSFRYLKKIICTGLIAYFLH